MQASRPRYDGSLDALRDAISPFVVSPGWLMYQEKLADKTLPDVLVAHRLFLRCMTDLCQNLSFGKAQLEHVFNKLSATRFKEVLTEEQSEDWVQTSCKRLQTAFRHVSQARRRKPPPRWLAHIDIGESFPESSMSQLSSVPGAGDPDGRQEEEEEEDDPGQVAQDDKARDVEDFTCTYCW